MYMSKKQTKKELDKEFELAEDDDNIELSSFDGDDEAKPLASTLGTNKESNIKPKKKRIITEEQRKILVDRLAYARSMRKKEAENKKVLQEDYLKQKEEEINERLIKKITSLQRKKETEMMKKYMSKEKQEEDESEVEAKLPLVEKVIIKKKRAAPKKKIVYQYAQEDDNGYVPPTPSLFFC